MSTTGPTTATTCPAPLLPFFPSALMLVPLLQRLGAADDLGDLFRDGGLAGAVERERQGVDHVAGVARGGGHAGHARAVLARHGFDQRAIDLGIDVAREQPREELVRRRLEEDLLALRTRTRGPAPAAVRFAA